MSSLLLAKGVELGLWLRVLVPLIMFMIYAVNQIVNRDRKGLPPKAPRNAPRRPPMPDPNARRPSTPVRPGGPQKTDPLLAEIQKFLKQSNAEKRSPGRPQPPAKPVRVEVISPRSGMGVGDSVGRPLDARHLDTGEFSARASQMTEDMKRGDAEREQHFQQTFSHKLGRLTDTSVAGDKAIAAEAPTASTAPVPPATPSDWLPLPTTKPEDLRRAFMLNEILQRPEHRW
jgi:hypothetical protein